MTCIRNKGIFNTSNANGQMKTIQNDNTGKQKGHVHSSLIDFSHYGGFPVLFPLTSKVFRKHTPLTS